VATPRHNRAPMIAPSPPVTRGVGLRGMERSVAEAAAILRIAAGADPKDLTSSPRSVPDYLAELGRDISGLKIGVDRAYVSDHTDSELTATKTLRVLIRLPWIG